MPFVHIRALPPAGEFDAGEALRAISREFATDSETEERHVTVTWQTLQPEHYVHTGQTAATQPSTRHPVLVEVLAPDFHGPDQIERMLEAAARAVGRAAHVSFQNVFVQFRPAHSGQVLDCGEIVRW